MSASERIILYPSLDDGRILRRVYFEVITCPVKCKLERPEQNENSAKLVLSMMSPLDREIALAISDKDFRIRVLRKTVSNMDGS